MVVPAMIWVVATIAIVLVDARRARARAAASG